MSLANAHYEFRGNQSVVTATHGSDDNLFIEFFEDAVHLEAKSREEGRPIYEDRIFIRIIVPGGKTVQVREAKLERYDGTDVEPTDVERFPRQWAQFKDKIEQVGSGTPLEQWNYLSRAQVMEMKSMKIHTVDQLAAQTDSAISNMGLGARDLRSRAQAFLDQAKDGGALAKVQTQLEDTQKQLAALQAQMKQINDIPDEKRGPGRPRKE